MAIEEVVADQYGKPAVNSPMRIARLLADEGAELRHAEIMKLWVKRYADMPYGAEFRNLTKFSDFSEALVSIRALENLRRKFVSDGDKDGLRLVREEALSSKKDLLEDKSIGSPSGRARAEIAEWITIWLQSPEVFENWIILRQGSADFVAKFGNRLKQSE